MKRIKVITAAVLACLIFPLTTLADSVIPYINYTYSEADGSLIEAPHAYIPEKIIYGTELGIGAFGDVADIASDGSGSLYILDSANNRVVLLDAAGNLQTVFEYDFCDESGETVSIKGAQGIYVNDRYIYICDTEHNRIVITDVISGDFVRIVHAPSSAVLGKDFIFKPKKLAVDSEYELYVVSDGTYEGIINMDWDGNFICFFAGNKVTSSAWDLFWRRFSSKKQRNTMEQLIPQDFSSIERDAQGFFLVTTYTKQSDSMVKRINPGGNNVIQCKSTIPIVGDPIKYPKGGLSGNSSFADITAGNSGIYACLDVKRGRVFCYNKEGYLLYSFGTISDQFGGFTLPSAVCFLDAEKIAVADNGSSSVTVFSLTEYGCDINRAVKLQNSLKYDEAIVQWEKILSANSNYQLAQNMIGKAYFSDGKYKTAMDYFKSASNVEMYSEAKKSLRNEWIYDHIEIIIAVVVVLLTFTVTLSIIVKRRKRKARKR